MTDRTVFGLFVLVIVVLGLIFVMLVQFDNRLIRLEHRLPATTTTTVRHG